MRIRLDPTGVVEAAVLAAAVAVPLHFNPQSQRVFEPDKLACLALLALTAGVGLAARWSSRPPRRAPRPSPVDVAVTAAAVLFLAAAATSIAPALSMWGLYRRGQGLIALLAFVTMFAAARVTLRRDGASERLRHALALATVPVSLYALLQRLGVDNIVWDVGQAAVERPFGPLGNPIFLGAYLVVVMPVLGAWLLESLSGVRSGRPRAGRTALVLGAGLLLAAAALVVGQSRGPVLGLLAGGLTLAVLRAGQLGRPRAAAGLTAAAALAALAAIALGQVGGERLGRLGELAWAGSRTAQERLMLWDALGGLAVQPGARTLLGHGPETTLLLLGPRLPEALARLAPDQIFDRAHNAVWEWWVAGGLAGVGVWLALYLTAFAVGLRAAGVGDGPRAGRCAAFIMLAAAVCGAGAAWALGGPGRAPLGLTAGLFGGLMLAVVAAATRSGRRVAARTTRSATASSRPAGVRAAKQGPVPAAPANERLLAAALMAGLAAHLVESAVGLPTAAGELHFWLYLGWLAALAGRSDSLVAAGARPARRAAPDAAGTDALRRAAWSAALVDGLALATVALAPLLVANRPGPLGQPALWLLPLAVWTTGHLLTAEPLRPGWARQCCRAAPAAMLVALLAVQGERPGAAATAYAVVLLAVTVALGAVFGAHGPGGGGRQPAAGGLAARRTVMVARRAALAAAVGLGAVVGWRAALAPVVADAYVRHGLEAAARRDLPVARQAFERAAALWPAQAAYAAYLAAVWREDARRAAEPAVADAAFLAAEEALAAAERRVPDAQAALLLAGLYRERGDHEQHPTARGEWWARAADWLDVALARSPWAVDTLLERGVLLERMGDAAGAGQAFQLAADLRPEVTAAWLGSARAALARLDAAAAERALSSAAVAVGPARVAAVAEAELQQAGAALTVAHAVVLARALAGDTAGARVALQAAEEAAPGDPLTGAVRDWLNARGER